MEPLRARKLRRILHPMLVAALAPAVSACIPPLELAPSPEASREAFLAYASSLQFLGADRDNQAGDEQPMVYAVGDPRNAILSPATPVARVEPEARAKRLSREQAARGRIVGRILSTGRFEPLGVERGVNYVWLDNMTGRAWRGLIIPANPAAPITTLEITPEHGGHDQAGAVWHYDPAFGVLPWIIIDDMCVGFARGRVPGGLRARLLRPERVGGRPDPGGIRGLDCGGSHGPPQL
jgi:hypothetical protein